MLYEILKTSKLGASFAPDMYTALWAQKLARDGEVKTLSGAPPLSFQANGTPLLDYLISGNTVQSGTPTPDNPVMPQGTGERTGNLLNTTDSSEGYILADGTISTSHANLRLTNFIEIPVDAGYITQSYGEVPTAMNLPALCFFDENKNYISGDSFNNEYIKRFSVPSNAKYFRTCFRTTMAWVMVNTGRNPLPYESWGYKIPISSNSTTTPVYLGEVESTRRIGKLVLTGEENITYSTIGGNSRFAIDSAFQTADYHIGVCSHYKYEFVNANNTVYHTSNNTSRTIFILDNNYTSAADFKTYLQQQYAAGTPVCVWYVLAAPETAVVNEPLRKIGEYADTVSMEQAGVEIPTVRGTNTLDVLTDVKPSNVYLKYKEV